MSLILLTLFKVDTSRMQNPWFQVLKPMLSPPKTLGFTV